MKQGGGNFSKSGENNNFRETGGNVLKQEIRNLWSMTKKSHQKFRRMKIKKFFGKR